MATPPEKPRLKSYVSLMEAFANGRLSGEEFEQRYFDLFKHDETIRPPEVAAALEDVFWAADSFYADPALRDEGDLDEAKLRARVRAVLSRLQHLLTPV